MKSFSGDVCLPKSNWYWSSEPNSWVLSQEEHLKIQASLGEDIFYMPGIREVNNVCVYERCLTGNFTLEVSITVEGSEFADAGGILVRTDTSQWLKACIERSRLLKWAVFTVFTTPYSDEACGPTLKLGKGILRLTREGNRFAFFYKSEDKQDWKFVRTCWWTVPERVYVGLFTQAPFSNKCSAEFSHLKLYPWAAPDCR